MYRLTSQRSSPSDGLENQPQKIFKKTSLHALPFFEGLPESTVQFAIAHAITLEYPEKCPIVLEKDWANSSVYFIVQGWLKICMTDFDG
jgi:CRP/FNR family transcriptional regulator, cyclic AMP receptor protein